MAGYEVETFPAGEYFVRDSILVECEDRAE